MVAKIKRFAQWINTTANLGKVWGITLLTFGTLVALSWWFENAPHSELVNTTMLVVVSIFTALFALVFLMTAVRFSRWYDASPRFQNWLFALTLGGLLAWLLFSVITHPTETFAFFKNEWGRILVDPVFAWTFKIMEWLLLGCFFLVIIATIASLFIRRLRKV